MCEFKLTLKEKRTKHVFVARDLFYLKPSLKLCFKLSWHPTIHNTVNRKAIIGKKYHVDDWVDPCTLTIIAVRGTKDVVSMSRSIQSSGKRNHSSPQSKNYGTWTFSEAKKTNTLVPYIFNKNPLLMILFVALLYKAFKKRIFFYFSWKIVFRISLFHETWRCVRLKGTISHIIYAD